jgi:hypothetical protein
VVSGTLGNGSILCVSAWESAGAEWKCGSVIYVEMLRLVHCVVLLGCLVY